MPDNTYLEKLSIENDQLLLIGLSSDASALVARLEGSPLWRSPALTGALQPDPRTHRDRFTLTAEVVIQPGAGKTTLFNVISGDVGSSSGTIDFLGEDELLEVTPKTIRLRKRWLSQTERARRRSRAMSS